MSNDNPDLGRLVRSAYDASATLWTLSAILHDLGHKETAERAWSVCESLEQAADSIVTSTKVAIPAAQAAEASEEKR